ncbi:hypothetical protein [Paenibacillus amylolyticus]|uniref:hypothetical protein n=1 Tax=Paenibacillus amylolyticus TaxID=1451 RepID=UPI003D974754
MRKWISFVIIFTPFFLLFLTDFNASLSTNKSDLLKDQIELISWVFSGIMALVSFFALFIGYMYENKLIASSNDLKLLYRPYTLSISDIRQILLSYESNIVGNKLINYMYWIYLTVSSFTIYVWGITVGFYTQFRFGTKLDFSLPSTINFGVYLFYFLLSGLLIILTFILNQVKNLKDPFRKGYLPLAEEICDLKYLEEQQDTDVSEIIFKNAPSLTFYKNPPSGSPRYEVVFFMPIKMKNFKFVIKLYDKDKIIIFKCFGLLNKITHVGDQFFVRLEDNLPEQIYERLKIDSTGEMKVYNENNEVISRFSLKSLTEDDNSFEIIPKNIVFERETIERDGNLVRGLNWENISFQNEI